MAHELTRRDFFGVAGALSAATVDRQAMLPLLRTLAANAGLPSIPPSVIRDKARFQILSPTLIRMEYAPTGQFIDALTIGVLNRSWSVCPYTAQDVDGWVEIATARMTVKYKLGSPAFTKDTLLVTWKGPGGVLPGMQDSDQINQWKWKFQVGEHTWKPEDVDVENLGGVPGDLGSIDTVELTESGPLSRNGYFVLDDSATAVWNPTTQWPEALLAAEGRQDLYFFAYGHDYPLLFRELTQLSGPIPMVPRYVFGTWVGDRAGYSADEWKRIVEQFREEEIPIDLIVIDSLSEAAIIWAGFGTDPEQFPNPKEFFAWMKERGVKVSINEHYGAVTRASDPNFEKARIALKLPPETEGIGHDLGDQAYAKVFMDVFHKPLLDDGLAFWWQDGSAGADISGLDGMLWTRHVEYEGQERITGKRTIVFCRLGEWGSYRYGAFFTGDLQPRWVTLRRLVQANVRAGNSLLPYINSLTGGHFGETIDYEMYLRWAQFSAFAPLFWWHGLWGLRFPWEYGDTIRDITRKFLQLRYRLIPYTYTFARLAHDSGMPIVRGTYIHYSEQEEAYTFRAQYLFGSELLVSPITKAAHGQPVTTTVYFPAGDHWYDYFTGARYAGGQVVSYECPLDRMPLFARASAILPMAPNLLSSDEHPNPDPLLLQVFAGDKPNTFRLYEDDGLSLDYRKKAYAWTPITYTPTPQGDHQIVIGPAEGRYEGQRSARSYTLSVRGVAAPERVTVGGRVLPPQLPERVGDGWSWSNTTRVLTITLATPLAIKSAVQITLHGAGTFQDLVALEQFRDFRTRVQRIKVAAKIRWAVVLLGDYLKKPPHILQVIGAVEDELNTLMKHPTGVAKRITDVQYMTGKILTALVMAPFDSSRQLPELDGGAAATMEKIKNKTFPLEAVDQMTRELTGCRLLGTAVEQEAMGGGGLMQNSVVHVNARVVYDTACFPTPPVVQYTITWPETGLPGWMEVRRDMNEKDGSVSFLIRIPSQLQSGTYLFRLGATVTWGAHHTTLLTDLPWVMPVVTEG